MGIERLLLVLAEMQKPQMLDVIVAVQKPELRTEAAVILDTLRRAGFRADADLRGQSLKSQFRRADR